MEPDMNAIYLMGVIHKDIAQLFKPKHYTNNINIAYNIPMIDLIPPDVWLKSITDESDKEISLDEFHF